MTLAKAGAPLAAAGLLTTTGGYPGVLLAVGAAGLTAAAGILTRAESPPPALTTNAAARNAGHGRRFSAGVRARTVPEPPTDR
ncbi:hypothetical protein [Actinoplanes sp. CA-252034]|uniref:hypothetical protein n=1 Tax=Actinoplanes sp. CA-252034 TaxID=3239906 RepID=UPI003D974FDC